MTYWLVEVCSFKTWKGWKDYHRVSTQVNSASGQINIALVFDKNTVMCYEKKTLKNVNNLSHPKLFRRI